MADQAPLMLSVSGLRGIVGKSLTPDVAVRFAVAAARWANEKASGNAGSTGAHVLVSRDSRPSGPMVEAAVVSGLLAAGCRVTRLGIATTPAVGVMATHLKADAAIQITASHNPGPWNGIKIITPGGYAPPVKDAQRIIDLFNKSEPNYVEAESVLGVEDDGTATHVHLQRILENIDVAAIARSKPRVLLDSVHGAGGPSTAALLEALGVQVIHLYSEPTGRFPHTPEPTAANLTGLCDAVKLHKATIGFAQDPDADRLAIVDENGRYIGEEYTLALCARQILDKHRGSLNAADASVVANLSTSRMIDDVVASIGGKVIRTPVGEANVVLTMKQENALVGGEGNGGIIWPKIGFIRDSLAGIALMLEMLAQTGQSLSQIVDSTPAYEIVKDKIPIKDGMAEQAQNAMLEHFKDATLDTQDGVRVDKDDRWLHVRASNTEPILRIIAEAPDRKAAEQLISEARALLS